MLQDLQLVQQAFALANARAIADIESVCVPLRAADGLRWYDTRPMLDPREHAGEAIDMAAQVLAYAEACGLIRRDAVLRHMVCITQPGRVG